MPEFDIMHSTYIPSKAKMLNNISTRGTAPDVPLLFLFKRGHAYADEARRRMKGVYTTPHTCVYYTDPPKNNEGKWTNGAEDGVLREHPPRLRGRI